MRLPIVELMLNTAYELNDRPSAPSASRVAAHDDTTFYFGCHDVDAAYAYLQARGVDVEPPTAASYGMKPALGSLVFLVIAPGTIAGWVPYRLTAWHIQPPLFGIGALQAFGVVFTLAGVALLVDCFARFALEGLGTPAPVAPTETLVASGPYRYVRNPISIAVLLIVAGQALLLGSLGLAAYDAYRAHVRRWSPQFRPWRGGSDAA